MPRDGEGKRSTNRALSRWPQNTVQEAIEKQWNAVRFNPWTPCAAGDLAMVAGLKDYADLGLGIAGCRQPHKPLARHQFLAAIDKSIRNRAIPVQIRNRVIGAIRIPITKSGDACWRLRGVEFEEVCVGVGLPNVDNLRLAREDLVGPLVADQCKPLPRFQC